MSMLFDTDQLNCIETGYVIVDRPFPRRPDSALSGPALLIVLEDNTTDTRGNHYRLAPQIPDSYWCALDHSPPFCR